MLVRRKVRLNCRNKVQERKSYTFYVWKKWFGKFPIRRNTFAFSSATHEPISEGKKILSTPQKISSYAQKLVYAPVYSLCWHAVRAPKRSTYGEHRDKVYIGSLFGERLYFIMVGQAFRAVVNKKASPTTTRFITNVNSDANVRLQVLDLFLAYHSFYTRPPVFGVSGRFRGVKRRKPLRVTFVFFFFFFSICAVQNHVGIFFRFEATGWLRLCANISVFVPDA